MKRILRSSNFWNAVFGTIFVVIAFRLTGGSELISAGIFSLFGIRSLVSGGADFVKANKGIYFDVETNRERLVK